MLRYRVGGGGWDIGGGAGRRLDDQDDADGADGRSRQVRPAAESA